MMPAIEKDFDLKGDDIVDLSTEKWNFEKKKFLRQKMGKKSKAKPLKQINDQKTANLKMAKSEKQLNETKKSVSHLMKKWPKKVTIKYGEKKFIATSLQNISCKI